MKCKQIVVKTTDIQTSDRFAVMKLAYDMGIKGYVKRRSSTSFVVVAEGEDEPLASFIDFISQHTIYIKTIGIEVEELPLGNYSSFEMK